MKTLTQTILSAACIAAASYASARQVYSTNVAGYIPLALSSENLIANQLDDGMGNTLDDVLPAGSGVLPGSTFTEWNAAANSLMPLSVFNGSTWSINYPFAPNGIGGVLDSPASTTITLVGSVVNFDFSTDMYTFTPPTRGAGTYLLALAAPLAPATFAGVVGRNPVAGDSVETIINGVESTTTFNGTSWNNGTPGLAVGQAAFFDLVAVPEPSTLVLAGLGAAIAPMVRRRLRSA